MTYLKVAWLHDNADQPVMLYSECDPERWEVRKVEVYRDGRMDIASKTLTTGSTWLGELPMPSLEEIARDGPFEPVSIKRDEFERIWSAAQAGAEEPSRAAS